MFEREEELVGRYSDAIYLGKGLGIIYVVTAHYSLTGVTQAIVFAVGTFYIMPFFFFVSGLLYACGKPVENLSDYGGLLKKKVLRILVPYFCIPLLLLVPKYVAGFIVELHNPVELNSLVHFLTDPCKTFLPLFWFLYILMETYIVYPLAAKIIRDDFVLLGLTVVLAVLPWPQFMVLNRFFYNLPFFVMGVISVKYALLERPDKLWRFAIPALIIFLTFTGFYQFDSFSAAAKSYYLLAGAAGSIGLLLIGYFLSTRRNRLLDIIKYVGVYSMIVYVLHLPVIGILRVFFSRVFEQRGIEFLVAAAIATAAGVSVPILLEKYVIRRSRILTFMILGSRHGKMANLQVSPHKRERQLEEASAAFSKKDRSCIKS